MRNKPWHSVFRNRRGAVCAVITALLGSLLIILGTWLLVCLVDVELHPLPDGTTPLVAVLLACKAFQYRDDRKVAEKAGA